jgi:2,4-dienoyl-CoA reductase-like NADH-dependent reductase (Old Yellow Enzyme family)
MAKLFEPLTLRGLTLPHRIFMAPMCQYSATGGLAGPWHIRHYAERALGGAALVVVEATAVLPEGRISAWDLGLWNDGQAEALSRLCDAVHEAGAKIAVQLAHAGRKASTRRPWEGSGALPESEGGWPVIGPGAEAFDPGYAAPRAMDGGDIRAVIDAFGEAGRRAARAGFDAVELHAAHGYLLHQFLSPLCNHRQDGYGGGFEGRSRLALEAVDALRSAIPSSMPLLARLSATDWLPGGWDLEECSLLGRALAGRGVDFIDVSSGGLAANAKPPVGPGYQAGLAARIKEASGVAVGAVGLITTIEQAQQIVLSGAADAVSLGRLLLRDPYWPLRQLPPELRRAPAQYLRAYP